MNMTASMMLATIGGGVLAEVVLYVVLHRIFRLDSKAAAMAIALLAALIYVPWSILTWPGADIFAIHLAIYLTAAYALGMIGGRVGHGWHWAPAMIVAFFVMVIITNVVFLGVAERGITGLFARILPEPEETEAVVDSRFPGTVSHDFQEKEALYNEYLKQVEAQHARGWKVRKGWLYKPVVGENATFMIAVADKDGAPVSGATVTGRFLRTSNSREDFDFAMHETGPGEYRVELKMPLHGLWDLVLHVRRGDDLHEIRAETLVGGGEAHG